MGSFATSRGDLNSRNPPHKLKNKHFAQELRPRCPSVLSLTQNFSLGASQMVTKAVGGCVSHAIPAKFSRKSTPMRTPVFRDSNTLILGLEAQEAGHVLSINGQDPDHLEPVNPHQLWRVRYF